jgi:erythromycin esterase-like protein/orotate phosphoribosyltransferase-like protein
MTRSTGLRRQHPRRVFKDRREAGQVLAGLLAPYRGKPDVVVLGLARGGVPVAYEVAKSLRAPLDAFIVRKLGAPGHEEFAFGALASGGRVVINDDVVRGLRISPQQLREITEREAAELARREVTYRSGRPPLNVAGKTVILVDDGLATGSSMMAAIQALRESEPAAIVIAVPAAPESTSREFAGLVDELVCASMPTPFLAVGESFWDFRQVTDDEVRELLATPTTGFTPVTVAPRPAELVAAAAIDAPGGVPPREVLDDLIGDARVVLIGESSHGTHEFYAARAEITKWLIEEKGFTAVAAEADWPDAYRVNRYVRGLESNSGDHDESPEQALLGFERFPAWMWRNTVMRDFVGWLRWHNGRCTADGRRATGFYGLDLYSLHRSMQEVVGYLETVDPEAAARARSRYACFDHSAGEDGQAYGYAAAFGAGPSCERQAVEQLIELQRNAVAYLADDGQLAEDELFYARQNALTVRNAEEYYRGMFAGRVTSWNMRDKHMAATLNALIEHLDHHSGAEPARIVVWAHNSHVGDARATEVSADGQVTIGQLARELYGSQCRLIGFSTYRGTVTAASDWGGVAERKVVRPALAGSIEELLHQTGRAEFYIPMHDGSPATRELDVVRLGRAIGVIYLPQTERQSHYFHVRPADQFDAMIHIDSTTALEPLEMTSVWAAGRNPETYPTGL